MFYTHCQSTTPAASFWHGWRCYADVIMGLDDGVEMSMWIWMGDSMLYDEDCMRSNVNYYYAIDGCVNEYFL